MFKKIQNNIVPIFIVLSTVFVIGFNLLASYLPLNNIYTNTISDKYSTMFTPAGIIFSIWGLIYVLLGIFAIWSVLTYAKNKEIIDKSLLLYTSAAALNCIWLVTWHYEYIKVSIIPMVLLLISLGYLYKFFILSTVSRVIKLVFSVYLGWISVATIANVAIVLNTFQWDGFGISQHSWTTAMLIVATLLGWYMLSRFKDKAYYLVIVWAAVGIWIRNPEDIAIFAVIFFLIISLLLKFFFLYARTPLKTE